MKKILLFSVLTALMLLLATSCGVLNQINNKKEDPCKDGHTFTSYVSNNDASCIFDGTKTAKCDVCGATDTLTEAGTAKGHVYSEYTSNNNATCTANGTKTATCDNCEAVSTVEEENSKLEHSLKIEEISKNATCTEPGEKKIKCENCSYYETEAIAAKGHSFDLENGYKAEDGHANKCSVCGANDTVTEHTPDRDAATEENAQLCSVCGYVIAPKLDHQHSYTIQNTENTAAFKQGATCTSKAQYYYSCSCGNVDQDNYFEYGEMLDHDYSEATCGKAKTCKDCGATDGEPTGLHDYEEATCQAPKTCKVCGATEGEKADHNYGEWIIDKAATTTENGEQHRDCATCGNTEKESIPKLTGGSEGYIDPDGWTQIQK